MEEILRSGMLFIQHLQINYKSSRKLMIWISNVSNPAWSYIVYFPLAYYLNRSVGRRVLWVAAISEWLNAVFKWILHGERPYWWGHEAGMCSGRINPCNQFPITCETGPGSPSGHCMVTISVFYIMISALTYHVFSKTRYKTVANLTLWTLFALITCAINISRCFILAHFPHQVISGSLVAILMARYLNLFSTTSMTLKHYVFSAGGMLSTAMAVYFSLIYLGLDPHWSITKAQRWCAHAHWIHLQSTLFFAVVKASSSLLGLGLAELISTEEPATCLTETDQSSTDYNDTSLMNRGICFLIALVFAFGVESIKLSQDQELLFYLVSYVKYVFVIFVISFIIPRCVKLLSTGLFGRVKKE